jgi:ethanolamine ammonia-lyase small subunit
VKPEQPDIVPDGVTHAAPSWTALAAYTPARVALGRSGVSLPTSELLSFGLAHARARDAVHAALDTDALRTELEAEGWPTIQVRSRAADRAAYLARPDWGRRLDEASRTTLSRYETGSADLALLLCDGLSAAAVQAHAPALLRELRPRLAALRLAPLIIATQARVALSDEIGECLGARLIACLIGERPGLSAPHSLGIYLTASPRVGRTDAERECISNIHGAGLTHVDAAAQLWLRIQEALACGLTGVAARPQTALGGL